MNVRCALGVTYQLLRSPRLDLNEGEEEKMDEAGPWLTGFL
jgi:hypothetical protein